MESKTLYAFDMDDTLLETPKLSSIVDVEGGEVITSNENIKEYVKKIKGIFLSLFFKEICFEKSNDFIVIVDCKTKNRFGSEYVDFIHDLTPEQLKNAGLKNSTKKDLIRTIGEENDVLILKPFPGFYDDEQTLGTLLNPEVFSVYKQAKNKMIVTGRKESLHQNVESNLLNLGVEIPNFGLHLFPGGQQSIVQYKTKVLINSTIANGWDEIHFFEDRVDWLDIVEKGVLQEFPSIKFYKHLVTTMKSKLSL
jgi:hypothetical protein